MVGKTFSKWNTGIVHYSSVSIALFYSNMEYARFFVCGITNIINEKIKFQNPEQIFIIAHDDYTSEQESYFNNLIKITPKN